MAEAPKYSPNPVPSDPEDLPRYIFEELLKLQGALEENPTTFIGKNATPARKKQGDIVYDGTNFDPGSGEGILYKYSRKLYSYDNIFNRYTIT